jgi:cytochrome c nitrite reductase small subunit
MRGSGLAQVMVGAALGGAAGVALFTFVYAKGYSYLTDDPEACANCHVMHVEHAGWLKGSHRSVATCNDCHTPPGALGKYLTKASNGFWHSFAFTTGLFPDTIRIKPSNRDVTEQACRKCHADITRMIDGPHGQSGRSGCVRCHSTVGHQ